MLTQINKTLLFTTFGVEDFNSLEKSVDNMAPSLAEYYLADLCYFNENNYLNKKDIEKSFSFGEYTLYLDYNEDIYLETDLSQEETTSLW